MKKRFFVRSISLLLCLFCLMSFIPSGIFAVDVAIPNDGDADGNGRVELADVLAIEKYLSDKTTDIDLTAADVNVDGVVDEKDSEMLRQHLVGNVTLPTEFCTITFNSDGGDPVAPIKVGKGNSWRGEMPTTARQVGYFNGWVTESGDMFYQDLPITGDITLTAVYGDTPVRESLTIDSFALRDQEPNLSFDIVSDKYTDADGILANIALVARDGSSPVTPVVRGSNGVFTVSAKGGFRRGCSYELILQNGINFKDMDKMYRKSAFYIRREEVDKLKFNNGLLFLKDTDEMNYTVGNETVPVIEIGFLNNDTGNENITGTFTYPGRLLKVGDYVCIYEKTDPRDRDYTDNLYADDALAYVQITGINGRDYSFRSLGDEDAEHILFMPSSIPYRVPTLPAGGATGTVNADDFDADAWAKLANTKKPEFEVGDVLVFYTLPMSELTDTSPCRYAKVTAVSGSDISYTAFGEDFGRDDLEEYLSQEFFVSLSVGADDIVDDFTDEERTKLLNDVATRALAGGFVEEAVNSMFDNALVTSSVRSRLYDNGFTDAEIEELMRSNITIGNNDLAAAGAGAGGGGGAGAGGGAGSGGRVKLIVEDTNIVPTIFYDDRYDNGVGVALDIGVVLSLDKKVGGTRIVSLKIELNASFEQQLSVGLDVGVDLEYEWSSIIPEVYEFTVKTAFDIKTYSSVSVSIKLYTVQEAVTKKKWTALTDTTNSVKVKAALRQINKLALLAKKAKNQLDVAEEYLDQIKAIKDKLPKVVIDGQEYSIDELQAELGMQDVSSEFDEVLSAEDETGNKVGIEQLMDKYTEMLNTECDWIEVFNKVLYQQEFSIKFLAIKLGVNFVVRANINIAIGADLEYEMGKRYMFWIDVKNGTSGSDTMDLLDERFGFQFYVMGTLGLKIGIRIEVAVGIISTKIGSVGVTAEVGPYLKLYGYFFYIYTRVRPAGVTAWTEREELQGALYIEFGIYLTVKFKAQAFENTFKYEHTLYDNTFPLLTAGERYNVYDFVLPPDTPDICYINDSDADSTNGITMALPDIYTKMRTMDLVTGDREQVVCPRENFSIRFSDSRFRIGNDGVITVSNVGSERYIECTMSLVWICDKLAFSKYDIDITVPVVWTLMSERERTEKLTASVAVGTSADGYKTVWTDSFTRLETFDLPEAAEILTLIGYDRYNDGDVNLKYGDVIGYRDAGTTNLKINGNTVFYFDLPLKKYSVVVNGIQNSDGTTSSRTYDAYYGETFDFSDIYTTGADDVASKKFSAFTNLVYADNGNQFVIGELRADIIFASRFGTTATLNANYSDISREAKFEFIGINAGTVPVRFKSGTIPDTSWIGEYVRTNGGEGAVVTSISPEVGRAENSITYIVNCRVTEPAALRTLGFVSAHPLAFGNQLYQPGSVIFRPTDPVCDGYRFVGWYTSPTFTEAFDFTQAMPVTDLTAYAKWEAVEYTITLESRGSTLTSVKVLYNGSVPTLTPPAKEADETFIGYFTDKDAGSEIKPGDTYTRVGNITLYARWRAKSDVNLATAVEYVTSQSATYNEKQHGFLITDKLGATDAPFTVYYKEEGGTGDFTSVKPVDAGTYEIALSRPTDDDYKALPITVLPTIKFKINRASLTLTGGNVFTLGGIVSIRTPDGIKGDGDVTYSLTKSGGSTTTQSSPVFSDLSGGTYFCTVKVAQGSNYLEYASYNMGNVSVAGYSDMRYDVSLRIKVNNSLGSGTDSDIIASVLHSNGSFVPSGGVLLDKSGYNDLEAGDNDTYFLCTMAAPWQICGFNITSEGNDDLDADEFALSAAPAGSGATGLTYVRKYTESVTINKDNSYTESEFTAVTTFFRLLSAYGNFYDIPRNVNLGDISTGYSFNYNGNITDQYGTYDSRLYYAPPTMTVTSGNSAYDNFIRFTGVTSFDIDKAGLAHYIAMNGGDSFEYTVTLKFGEGTRYSNQPKIVKIAVTVPSSLPYSENASMVPEGAGLSLSPAASSTRRASGTLAPSVMLLSSFTVNNRASTLAYRETVTLTIPDEEISAKRGEVIELPVKLASSDYLWGVLASAEFDTDAFELLGWSVGDVFDADRFRVQKDLTTGKFRFLATNDELTDIDGNGTLLKLQFKVKDSAEIKTYTIKCEVSEAVNTYKSIDTAVGNGLVAVKQQSNPPTGDAPIYPYFIMAFCASVIVLSAVSKKKRKSAHTH